MLSLFWISGLKCIFFLLYFIYFIYFFIIFFFRGGGGLRTCGAMSELMKTLSPAYARNSVQTSDFRPVCLKSSLIGFWMKTGESAKEKGALRSIALLSYRVFACRAGLCRFVIVGRLRDQRDLRNRPWRNSFIVPKTAGLADSSIAASIWNWSLFIPFIAKQWSVRKWTIRVIAI